MHDNNHRQKDMTQELLDHEPAVAGTSEDDKGEVKTESWPSEMPKSEFTDKQQQIVKDWVRSNRQKLTLESMREFSEGRDYTHKTARKTIMRAFPDKRDISDLTRSERFCIGILAYEGVDSRISELEDKYPISGSSLHEAKFAFPDLIEQYEGEIDEEMLQNEADKYREDVYQKQQKLTSNKDWSEEKRQIRDLLLENPSMSREEIRRQVGTDIPRSVLSGTIGGVVSANSLERDVSHLNGGVARDVEETTDQSEDLITIEIELDDQDVKRLLGGEEMDMDIRSVVVDELISNI